MGVGPGEARAAGDGGSRLAWGRHGHLCDPDIFRLDASPVAAKGFAAVRLALAGGGFARSGISARAVGSLFPLWERAGVSVKRITLRPRACAGGLSQGR